MKANQAIKMAALSVACGLLAAGNASAQQSTMDGVPAQGNPGMGQTAGGQAGSAPNFGDQKPDVDYGQDFVNEAEGVNDLEVRLGKMVLGKTQNKDVKQFAQKMVRDHTEANEKLKQTAQAAGLQFKPGLDPVGEAGGGQAGAVERRGAGPAVPVQPDRRPPGCGLQL